MTRARIRFFWCAGLAAILLAGPAPVRGQVAPDSSPPGVQEPPPAPDEALPPPEMLEPEDLDAAEAEPESRAADTLETLFDKLRRATSDEEARSINRAIQLRWIQSGSDTVDLLMRRALEAMKTKDYPLSLDLLDAVIDLRPGYAEGWNKRATVYYILQDFGRSIGDIEQTLRLEPRHFGALTGLGSIFKQLGKREDALRAFERSLEIYPRLGSAQKAYRDLIEAAEDEDI